jgi:hypothetical protein
MKRQKQPEFVESLIGVNSVDLCEKDRVIIEIRPTRRRLNDSKRRTGNARNGS